VSNSRFEGDLFALVQAYAGQAKREIGRHYRPVAPVVYALDDARLRLRGQAPRMADWTSLKALAPDALDDGPTRASYLASTLSAGMELIKEGSLEAKQFEAFADLYLRARRLEAAE
jgi:segregation and condensation protein A